MLRVLKNLLVSFCVVGMVVGCASQPPTTKTHITQIKNDFASHIGASVDYVTNGNRTFIVLDVDNPNMEQIEIWFSQSYQSVGSETVRKRRLIVTNRRLIQQTIRASKLEKGIKEVIVFNILDTKGKVLLTTEPIENESDIVQNKEHKIES